MLNISNERKEALKEIRLWNSQKIRVQEKGSLLAILDNSDYGNTKYRLKLIESHLNNWKKIQGNKRDNQINNWVLK